MEEQVITLDWLYSPAFYWFFGLILGYLIVWLAAFFAGRSNSTRLETTVLQTYLAGVVIHMIVALVGFILLFFDFYTDTIEIWDVLLFLLGNIVIIILDIVFTIVLSVMIKRIPA